jgi:hypothetical protein
MDSGTTDGGPDQELNRLANFLNGGNENPTSTQPGPTPRAQQLALPMFPFGSPAATNLLLTNPDAEMPISTIPYYPPDDGGTANRADLAVSDGPGSGGQPMNWFDALVAWLSAPGEAPPSGGGKVPEVMMDRLHEAEKGTDGRLVPRALGDTTHNGGAEANDTLTRQLPVYAAIFLSQRALDTLAPEETAALKVLEAAGKVILKPVMRAGKKFWQIFKVGKKGKLQPLNESGLRKLLKEHMDEAAKVAPNAGAVVNGVKVPTLTVSKDAAAMAREAGQVFAKTTQGWSAADKAAFWESLARQIEAVHSPAWVSVAMKGTNGEFVFSGGSFGVHGLVIFPDGSVGIIGKTVDVAIDLKTGLVTVTKRLNP